MGVIIPSVNAVVESDFWDIWVLGVTFHYRSISIAQPSFSSNSAMKDLRAQALRDKDLRGLSATAVAEVISRVYEFGALLSEH